MSLEYYLFCKEQYEEQIRNIDAIFLSQDMIQNYTKLANIDKIDKHLETNQLFVYTKNNELVKQRERISKLKDICIQQIKTHCNHNYVDDYIDISPECSQKITYCTICEHTK